MAKTKFEIFHDGIVSFWQLDEKRRPVLLINGIRYQNRVVGIKRNYNAEIAGHIVEKLIRIPRTDLVIRGTFAVIGTQQFRVAQAQTIWDTIPHCTDVTLEQPDVLLSFAPEISGAGGRF